MNSREATTSHSKKALVSLHSTHYCRTTSYRSRILSISNLKTTSILLLGKPSAVIGNQDFARFDFLTSNPGATMQSCLQTTRPTQLFIHVRPCSPMQ